MRAMTKEEKALDRTERARQKKSIIDVKLSEADIIAIVWALERWEYRSGRGSREVVYKNLDRICTILATARTEILYMQVRAK